MINWFIYIGDGEYYNHGRIVGELENKYILVNLQASLGPPTTKLYSFEELSDNENMFFFKTQEALADWLEWLETPSENSEPKLKIVNFKKEK